MKDIVPGTVTTADDIVVRLTDAVHEHRVLPGMKLNEDEVGEIFGVSRTLARQALRAMSHSGLVTIERNRGAFVSRPSVKEAREVFEARALLEPQTARAAAERATPDDTALLEQHIEKEHAALAGILDSPCDRDAFCGRLARVETGSVGDTGEVINVG